MKNITMSFASFAFAISYNNCSLLKLKTSQIKYTLYFLIFLPRHSQPIPNASLRLVLAYIIQWLVYLVVAEKT